MFDIFENKFSKFENFKFFGKIQFFEKDNSNCD